MLLRQIKQKVPPGQPRLWALKDKIKNCRKSKTQSAHYLSDSFFGFVLAQRIVCKYLAQKFDTFSLGRMWLVTINRSTRGGRRFEQACRPSWFTSRELQGSWTWASGKVFTPIHCDLARELPASAVLTIGFMTRRCGFLHPLKSNLGGLSVVCPGPSDYTW